MRNLLWLAMTLFAAGTLAGCIAEVTFTPLGEDVSLDGEWRIQLGSDGPEVPATTISCENAGIAQVQLEVAQEDGDRVMTPEAFRFDCAEGSFDTRPEPVLEHGTYEFQWVALDDSGTEIGRGEPQLLNVETKDHETVNALFIVEDAFNPYGNQVSLNGVWQLDLGDGPENANATSCEEAGMSKVRLDIFDASGSRGVRGTSALTFDCFQATFNTMPMKVLQQGQYKARWTGLDDSGTAIGQSPMVDVDASADQATVPMTAIEVGATGFDPRGSDASMQGSWVIRGQEATSSSCGNMGIADVQLLFKSADGNSERVLPNFTWPCPDGGFDTRPEPVLAAGTYQVEWIALDDSGGEVYHLMSQTIEASEGGHVVVPEANFGEQTGALNVQLNWQRAPEDSDGGSCAQAQVDSMMWTIRDSSDNVAHQESGNCFDSLPPVSLPYDTYSVEITATSEKDDWATTCTGLTVDSSEVTYECFVELQL